MECGKTDNQTCSLDTDKQEYTITTNSINVYGAGIMISIFTTESVNLLSGGSAAIVDVLVMQ